MDVKSILVTRPKGDEVELTDRLHALDFRIIHEPLTEIMLRHDARHAVMRIVVDEPDAVIITSRHGAQALALLTEMRDMFLLCVGDASAASAQALGFTRVAAAQGNVASLVDYIRQGYDEHSRFIYVSGDHVRSDLSMLLPEMLVERIIAYEAMAATDLSDTLMEQLRRGQISGVTFFSQRAAMIFMALLTRANLREVTQKLRVVALSETVALPLRAHSWRGIHIAREATLASMMECVDNAFKESASRLC